MKDLVSIITPTFNSEKHISETIKSIQAQTYTNWELLITDDCSTDNTASLINSIRQNDDRIKLFVQEKNQGTGVARIRCFNESKGDIIAFCDSDDIWKKNKLERQIQNFDLKKSNFIYTAYWTRNKFKILNPHIIVPAETRYHDILKTCHIYTSTVLISKKLLVNNMSKARKRQDFVTWIRVLENFPCAIGINEPLMGYLISDSSLSSNKLNVASIQWRVYRKELKLSLILSMFYFTFYAFNGFFKRVKQKNFK